MASVDCSQPSIFSYFYLMIERAEGICEDTGRQRKKEDLTR